MLDENVSVLGIDYKEDMPINSQYNVKQIDKKLADGARKQYSYNKHKGTHMALSIIHIREHLPIMVRYKYLQYMIYIAYLFIMAFCHILCDHV